MSFLGQSCRAKKYVLPSWKQKEDRLSQLGKEATAWVVPMARME